MIGVYIIINKISKEFYVGSSRNLQARKKDHFKKKNLKSYDGVFRLHRDIQELGKDNFEFKILELCCLDCIHKREEFYIDKLKATEKGYNVSSKAIPMHDEYISKNHGKRLREWNLKKWQEKDYREMKSKKSSDLQKERLKDETYFKIKVETLKKSTDTMKKKIGQYDKQGKLLAIYEGIREAERATGVKSQSICKVAKGDKYRKSAGGFVWKYH